MKRVLGILLLLTLGCAGGHYPTYPTSYPQPKTTQSRPNPGYFRSGNFLYPMDTQSNAPVLYNPPGSNIYMSPGHQNPGYFRSGNFLYPMNSQSNAPALYSPPGNNIYMTPGF